MAAWLAFAGPGAGRARRRDARGAAAVAELRAAGVEPRLAVDDEQPTGTCVVLVAPGGERSMLPGRGGERRPRAPRTCPTRCSSAGGHLHVAGYALLRAGSRAGGAVGDRAGRGGRDEVSVDPSSAALLSPAFLELAEGARLLLPNAAEAVALTGESDPVLAARALSERFRRSW